VDQVNAFTCQCRPGFIGNILLSYIQDFYEYSLHSETRL